MADKELFRVRRKFVEKVSEEIIVQLLDDLLEDGVINDREMEAIIKKNQTSSEKASDLIDRVRKKGDAASRKMITHLEERDHSLFSDLGLSANQPAQPAQPRQPAQPAAEPEEKEKWSNKLIPTTEAFWTEKQNDKDVYPAGNCNITNRVALLITNIEFSQLSKRDGAEKDEANMEKLLHRGLGYEVVKHTNLTAERIDEAVIEFSKHPKLKDTDSVFVVIMSHGKLGAVCGVNWTEDQPDEFPIDNIYKHLGSEKCPALLNKPKVIIIQACRGKNRGSVLVNDSAKQDVVCDDMNQPGPSGDDVEEDNVKCVHKEKDFISLLSSTPDTVSYRDTLRGSLLIQFIVEVFNTYAPIDDIHELFRKVMQRFEDLAFQMPTIERCSLTRRFYLFPGI